MSFKDYSTTPSANTALGDGTYIGPSMLRNKVRPALQQIAADGKDLANRVDPGTSVSLAGKVLGWDGSGAPVPLTQGGADSALRADLAASTGGDQVNTSGTGTGAVLRTVRAKLNDIYHAKDAGLVGDGSDETTKLTNFFNHAIANPGVPHLLEAKTYGISASLPTINVSNVWIEGVPGSIHDVGAVLSGTVIKWVGTSNAGKMLTVTPATGASAQFLTGVRLRGIGFDCNSLIAYGARIESARECEFILSGANATNTLFDLGVTSGTLGEALDLQRNIFRLSGRQVEAPSGVCLKLGGTSAANASMNELWCDFHHQNAAAIICSNSDNNDWRFIRCYAGGTATESVQFLGGAAANTCVRDEIVWHITTNKPLKVYGTDAYTVASYGHRIFFTDWDNGTPAPVLGTGAWVDCEMAQSFTPSITGTAGTGLTTSSVSASYIRQSGFIDIVITFVKSAGTGYASLSATLPFACAGTIGFASAAKERATTGKLFAAFVDGAASTVSIQSVDGATAIPDGTYNVTARYRVR